MNNFKNNKKFGFSLMELAIAVMIVGLLLTLTIPIVKNQLSKSDEYAYYMAYKTVEKLGGQIVALGDPEGFSTSQLDSTKFASENQNIFSSNLNLAGQKVKLFFTSLGNKFVYTEKYLFNKLFPTSSAIDSSFDWVDEWDEETYDENKIKLQVCSGIQVPTGEVDEEGNPIYYDKDAYQTDENGGFILDENNNKIKVFNCDTDYQQSIVNTFFRSTCSGAPVQSADYNPIITNILSKSAENFCNQVVKTKCTSNEYDSSGNLIAAYTVEGYKGTDIDDDDNSYEVYKCAFYEKFPSVPVTEGSGQIDCISVPDTCKPAYGYYGMENTAGSCAVVCNCRGNKRETQNNDNVCCSPKTGYKAYAHSNPTASMTESQYCIYCPSNQDFNPQTNSCCPEFSVYNGNACTCVEGYQMKDGACHRVGCASGLHFDPDTETCVINPPIQTSKRFCELINDNWNTASHNCNTFSNHIYSDVYNAALGTNGKYISIMSKIGAFKNINPNIVFQNGLKLWILGDKAASIPGLSFTTEGISSNQNICKEKLNGTKYIASKEACLASSSNGEYFCQGEGHCYSLVSGADKMGDARNCCASTDLSTISYAANYDKDNRYFAINGFTVFVDINGNKGSGTLWEDVFPFYVSSNGVVYPAYPLDGDKSKNAGDSTLYKAGNGVDSLSVDVYYYDSEGGTDYARKKVLAYSNVSYARGACFSRKVDLNTPYCQNLGLKVKGSGSDANIKSAIESPTNPCNSHPCTVTVRNKLRFF